MGFDTIKIKKLLEMTGVMRRDQVRENKFYKHNFTHSILSLDRPLKPSSGNTSNAFFWRYLNPKGKKFTHEKLLKGGKKIICKSTATRTAITIILIIIYRKNMTCTTEKKRKNNEEEHIERTWTAMYAKNWGRKESNTV